MKNWDYYRAPNIEYFGYEQSKEYRDKLVYEIDNERLTAAERKIRLDAVKKLVRDHERHMNSPYDAELKRLKEEFWDDAREELGYCSWLTDDGVLSLENKAYEDGHGELSEFFRYLRELSEWLYEMKDKFR